MKDNISNQETNRAIRITSYSCKFKQYGDVERICTKCGYHKWELDTSNCENKLTNRNLNISKNDV